MDAPPPAARRVVGALATALGVAPLLLPAAALAWPWNAGWALGVGGLGAWAVAAAWGFAPWVPTPAGDLPRIVAACGLSPGDRFVELGAGDARVSLAVARATGARAVAVEWSPLHVALARVRVALGGGGVQVVWADLRRVSLGGAQAVYLWGTAHGNDAALGARLAEALPTGARVVSRSYPVPGLPVERVDTVGAPLYVHRVPSA